MTIANDHVVTIEYTLTNDDNTVLDSSDGHGPLSYLHGKHNIVPGLEKELTGKAVGDETKVSVAPEEGYGSRREDLVTIVPKGELAHLQNLEVGAQLQGQSDQGAQVFTVMDIADDTVTLDGNHPLAGMTLHFDVKIVDVRPASEEELEHGHAHGAGGHQH